MWHLVSDTVLVVAVMVQAIALYLVRSGHNIDRAQWKLDIELATLKAKLDGRREVLVMLAAKGGADLHEECTACGALAGEPCAFACDANGDPCEACRGSGCFKCAPTLAP